MKWYSDFNSFFLMIVIRPNGANKPAPFIIHFQWLVTHTSNFPIPKHSNPIDPFLVFIIIIIIITIIINITSPIVITIPLARFSVPMRSFVPSRGGRKSNAGALSVSFVKRPLDDADLIYPRHSCDFSVPIHLELLRVLSSCFLLNCSS